MWEKCYILLLAKGFGIIININYTFLKFLNKICREYVIQKAPNDYHMSSKKSRTITKCPPNYFTIITTLSHFSLKPSVVDEKLKLKFKTNFSSL